MFLIRRVVSVISRCQNKNIRTSKLIPLRKISITMPRFSAIVENDESEEIIKELCQKDPELEKKLRILMLEVEVMRQDGRRAPDTMYSRHWKHLMDLPSRNQRTNYLLFLWKTEKSKENDKARKAARKIEYENRPEPVKENPDDVIYGITDRSLFLRIRDPSINNFDNFRALQSIMHGQPVIIDCSYENDMVYREAVNAAKQMTMVFADNRIHKDPFNVYMCNVKKEGEFMDQMRRNIPNIEEPWFPMNIHTNSYLDLFPKEKLVYLTPHCRQELTEYDHDSIYIIGCMVDKISNEPLSLARAKRDGLRMAKLPLDRYLQWAPGAKKNLNINHMVPIMADLRITNDWEFALRHIPRRKLMETKILQMQNSLKNPNLKREVFKSFSNVPGYKKLFQNQTTKKYKKSLYIDDDSL